MNRPLYALEQSDFRNLKIHFELWTTGRLRSKSQERIDKLKRELSPNTYSFDVRLAPEIEHMAEATNYISLLRVLHQHFLDHPIAEMDTHQEIIS